jgi:outer membrane immunogenic protein
MRPLLFADASLIALIAATPALAADMSPRMPLKAPLAAAFSWTGCYIGAHVGGGWGSKDFRDVPAEGLLVDADGIETLRDDISGFLGGGQIGCDYQIASNWVIGIEGQFAGADISGSVASPFGLASPFYAKTDWLANLTGRVAYAWDHVLLYAKGGAGWADDKYSALYGSTYSASETRPGWTLGGGLEWAFANGWSAKLEYLHYDLGTRTVAFASGSATSPEFVTQRIDTLTVGLNWRFGAGPLVAKY